MIPILTVGDVVAPMATAAVIYNKSDRLSEYPGRDGATMVALEDDLLRRLDRVLYVSHAPIRWDSPLVGRPGAVYRPRRRPRSLLSPVRA